MKNLLKGSAVIAATLVLVVILVVWLSAGLKISTLNATVLVAGFVFGNFLASHTGWLYEQRRAFTKKH